MTGSALKMKGIFQVAYFMDRGRKDGEVLKAVLRFPGVTGNSNVYCYSSFIFFQLFMCIKSVSSTLEFFKC